MLALALMMMLQASAAPGGGPPAEPPLILNPDWVAKPSASEFAQYYPGRAMREEVTGRAVVRCLVTASGTLESCAVQSESPSEYGFGDAALRLTKSMTMRPVSKDGVPTAGGAVRIPISFNLPGVLDLLTGLYACYGVTAVNWKAHSNDPDAQYAFGYFAAQAALKVGFGMGTPESYEDSLKRWREAAAGPDASRTTPSLATCMKLVPPAPPAPK